MWRTDSLDKVLMVAKTEGKRRRGLQRIRIRWLVGITDSMDMSLSKLLELVKTGKPGMLQSMGLQSRTQLSDWTELTYNVDYQWVLCSFWFLFYICTISPIKSWNSETMRSTLQLGLRLIRRRYFIKFDPFKKSRSWFSPLSMYLCLAQRHVRTANLTEK